MMHEYILHSYLKIYEFVLLVFIGKIFVVTFQKEMFKIFNWKYFGISFILLGIFSLLDLWTEHQNIELLSIIKIFLWSIIWHILIISTNYNHFKNTIKVNKYFYYLFSLSPLFLSILNVYSLINIIIYELIKILIEITVILNYLLVFYYTNKDYLIKYKLITKTYSEIKENNLVVILPLLLLFFLSITNIIDLFLKYNIIYDNKDFTINNILCIRLIIIIVLSFIFLYFYFKSIQHKLFILDKNKIKIIFIFKLLIICLIFFSYNNTINSYKLLLFDVEFNIKNLLSILNYNIHYQIQTKDTIVDKYKTSNLEIIKHFNYHLGKLELYFEYNNEIFKYDQNKNYNQISTIEYNQILTYIKNKKSNKIYSLDNNKAILFNQYQLEKNNILTNYKIIFIMENDFFIKQINNNIINSLFSLIIVSAIMGLILYRRKQNIIYNKQKELLQISESAFSEFFKLSPIPICTLSYNEQKIINYNIAFISFIFDTYNIKNIENDKRIIDLIILFRNKGIIKNENIKINENNREKHIIISSIFIDANRDTMLFTIIDISEQIIVEEKLKKALKIAEHSNSFKSQFIANISHEIRTPMNGVVGMLEILTDTKLNKEQLNYLKSAKSSCDTLLFLINDLLDYSKLEAGKMSIYEDEFEIYTLFEESLSLFKSQATQKNIKLIFNFSSEIPLIVISDSNKIKQIIWNLISNALKFTLKGQIIININLLEKFNDNIKIIIDIIDTGIGITEEQISNLFNIFTQGDNSISRKFGGTGLGLSICKRLVELLNGQIIVESVYTKGSKFSVILPLKIPIENTNSLYTKKNNQKLKIEENININLNILVFDDNEINIHVITTILKNIGCKVKAYLSPIDIDKIITNDHFDLILMDIEMPEINGYEATQIVRNMHNSIPIIALTAHALIDIKHKCLTCGMNDFITKPIKKMELVQLLKKYIQPIKICDTLLNIDALKQKLGDDDKFITSLLNLFLNQINDSLIKLQESINLQLTINVATIAHKLKGAAGNMLNNILHEQAHKVETLAKQSEEFSTLESELIILIDLLKQHQICLENYIKNKI